MSTKPTFVLLTGEDAWQVVVSDGASVRSVQVNAPADAGPRQRAAAVLESLKSAGYDAHPVVLALHSSLCFAASIRIDDLPKADANAWLFRLEEQLPFAAETIVADFIPSGADALGVCVRTETIAPLVEALTTAGVDISAIVPAAILAAQGCGAAQASMLVVPEPSKPTAHANLLSMREGKPARWATVPAIADAIALHAKLLASDAPPHIVATSDTSRPLLNLIASATGATPEVLSISATNAIALAAGQITAGKVAPLLNFRRGTLGQRDKFQRHRRAINFVLAAAAIFFLSFTLIAFIRAKQFRQVEASADGKIRSEFLAQFPNWSGPINATIVESEKRKALAAAGSALPTQRGSALNTLASVLTRLPSNDSLKVSRMSFGEASFELEGSVNDPAQIDALVAAAKAAGLNVPPPQSRKENDNAWSFVLRGARPADASPIAREAAK